MAMTTSDIPRLRRRPTRPSADRVQRLTELGEWHREWTARHADAAEFHPQPGSDYNLHHVDLDAPVAALNEFHDRARTIMGLTAE